MNHVFQDKFGDDGNCFQACIASILELPIEIVPDFCRSDDKQWYMKLVEWLRPRGYFPMTINFSPLYWSDEQLQLSAKHFGFTIVTYVTKRHVKRLHSCVAFAGQLVHDPMNDGGILGNPWDWEYIFLVPFSPASGSDARAC